MYLFKRLDPMLIRLLTAIAVLLLQVRVHAQEVSHPEYMEVAKNVCLHVTDVGKGRPVVFIHGFPLSDEMYEGYTRNSTI